MRELTIRADQVYPFQKPEELLEASPKGASCSHSNFTLSHRRVASTKAQSFLEHLEEYAIITINSLVLPAYA
jgi:hypothetical protein